MSLLFFDGALLVYLRRRANSDLACEFVSLGLGFLVVKVEAIVVQVNTACIIFLLLFSNKTTGTNHISSYWLLRRGGAPTFFLLHYCPILLGLLFCVFT